MTKGSTRSSRETVTTPLPSLKQARLVGINDYLKSVRQKSTVSDLAHNRLKQAGLAAFGFDGVNTIKKTPDGIDAVKMPPSKRRKVVVDLEAQFDQETQPPESSSCNPFNHAGDEYSSPLSSPPPEGSSPMMPSPPTSSFIAIPPPPLPAAPVTPKRRRLVEIPDSKSPPFTPFTPYVSPQEKNRSGSPTSPTVRLKKSPITPHVEEGDDDDDSEMSSGCRSPALVPTQILPQKPFASSPKPFPRPKIMWQDEDDKEDEQGGRIIETEEAVKMVEAESADRDRVVKSSQWWENEDTQNAPLSTQYTQDKQPEEIATVLESLRQDTRLRGPIIGPIRNEPPFRANLLYKIDPPLNITNQNDFNGDGEFQDAGQLDYEEYMQKPFCRMTPPIPLKFHDDTPKSQSDPGNDSVLPTGEDFSGSTASEEDSGEINESQGYPAYGAYRTQQFPSSFYQHNTYRHPSPEPLLSSQLIPPIIINRTDSAVTDENRDEDELPQSLPGPVVGGGCVTPGDDNAGEKEPSQFLPGMADEADMAARDDSQFLPVIINKSDAVVADEMDNNRREEQDNSARGDEDDGEGLRGRRTRTVTRSQLLPSELMETFPMPPPLSQFSSYGPYGYEYWESET